MDLSVSIRQQNVCQLKTTVKIWQLLGLSIELVVQVVGNEGLHKSLEKPIDARQIEVVRIVTSAELVLAKVCILPKPVRDGRQVVVAKGTLLLLILCCTLIRQRIVCLILLQ